jgi:predicted dehydrogenase
MIKAALIGAGQRGKDTYASYALAHPNEIKFVAVADPNKERREEFVKLHCIEENNTFSSWEELLERPKFCDAVFICTQDRMHFEPAVKALKNGYNILLEKPMSPKIGECIKIIEASKETNSSVTVAHVLRYTYFFQKLKEILDSKLIGDLVNINLNENVGYWHYAHSYVRGNWRNSDLSSPMILAKSCHDLDILVWLIGKKPLKLSSFGSLKHFKEDNAPEGSEERCLSCKVEDNCPYSALKLYLGNNTGWPDSVVTSDFSMEGRIKALEEGPYGRCVYRSDNNVVDHQVVNIQFEDNITAAFTMSGFTNKITRKINIMGTLGEIIGDLEDNKIEITLFNGGEKQTIEVKRLQGGHSGGDTAFMKYFANQIEDKTVEGLTTGEASLLSHVMAFAAEESILKSTIIDIEEFMKENSGI